MNILLVEDDPTDRKLLSVVLNTSGNRVMEQSSAEEAFAAIKSDRQMILLDLKLPGMDGLALARLLKKDDETRHIPIVATTAAPEKFSREEALRAGCDAYILKPVDTRKLSQQLARVAEQHG